MKSKAVPAELIAVRNTIRDIAAKHGTVRIALFGSMARGDAGPDSDVDFLVQMEPGRSLVDMAGLKWDLEELLQRPVDIVSEKSLVGVLRDHILAEAVSL
ncbi:MAG: nucleotidyltransferase [Sulfobacillus benefaciens]|uniref:Nucleotidyltransferase n=1 Tax=Sulfobacillus benefaciens TaxID=453960 RepID=A0A2T2WQG6_9FIRM|nr:MAG: nucleotidyltransferase [Sulfobacillus benefaciens]